MKNKTGIFGGAFDPFHLGHLNSVLSVAEQFDLDQVRIVPANISPGKAQIQGSTAEQRLKIIELGIEGHEDLIQIDRRELERGGVSYTVDTLKTLASELDDSLVLIVGLDQFLKFDEWKNFSEILSFVDLVVTSRPGLELPIPRDEWPSGVAELVEDSDPKQAILKTGKNIYFHQLDDVEASSTEIRRKLRLGQDVQTLIPQSVVEYIRRNKLYESVQKHIGDFEKFTQYCAGILTEKGGINVQSYDLRAKSAPSEFTLISSGTSTRHASALAEHVVKEVKKEYGVWPENIEGQSEGRWVVIDYGALIVHVFYDFVRQEYRLEDLWSRR